MTVVSPGTAVFSSSVAVVMRSGGRCTLSSSSAARSATSETACGCLSVFHCSDDAFISLEGGWVVLSLRSPGRVVSITAVMLVTEPLPTSRSLDSSEEWGGSGLVVVGVGSLVTSAGASAGCSAGV